MDFNNTTQLGKIKIVMVKGEKGDMPTSYLQLSGKPSINGVPLEGNKTTAQLLLNNASNITTGTLAYARLANLPASKVTSGVFDVARIPDLDAAKIISGVFDVARIPDLAASKITSGTLDAARIPNLNASKITAGTLGAARLPLATTSAVGGVKVDGTTITVASGVISVGAVPVGSIPDLAASKITSGTLDAARIPNLAASKITSGTIGAARLPLATTSAVGGVKVDGTTITVASGVISTPRPNITLTATNGIYPYKHDGDGGKIFLNGLIYTGYTLTMSSLTYTELNTQVTRTVSSPTVTPYPTGIMITFPKTVNIGTVDMVTCVGTITATKA